ncbi:MAG: hypothetical protein JO251_04910 [Verrucomicrobia bacterium]|nr:hypothetical protein [Verrucomicrobiota bacterium]
MARLISRLQDAAPRCRNATTESAWVLRTMAERVNAGLKDEFGARFLRVRGALKVKCHLVFGIVALAVDQIIRAVDLRTAPT